jgi:hypothetical protein
MGIDYRKKNKGIELRKMQDTYSRDSKKRPKERDLRLIHKKGSRVRE